MENDDNENGRKVTNPAHLAASNGSAIATRLQNARRYSKAVGNTVQRRA